jgi:hypothetical protein
MYGVYGSRNKSIGFLTNNTQDIWLERSVSISLIKYGSNKAIELAQVDFFSNGCGTKNQLSWSIVNQNLAYGGKF